MRYEMQVIPAGAVVSGVRLSQSGLGVCSDWPMYRTCTIMGPPRGMDAVDVQELRLPIHGLP